MNSSTLSCSIEKIAQIHVRIDHSLDWISFDPIKRNPDLDEKSSNSESTKVQFNMTPTRNVMCTNFRASKPSGTSSIPMSTHILPHASISRSLCPKVRLNAFTIAMRKSSHAFLRSSCFGSTRCDGQPKKLHRRLNSSCDAARQLYSKGAYSAKKVSSGSPIVTGPVEMA